MKPARAGAPALVRALVWALVLGLVQLLAGCAALPWNAKPEASAAGVAAAAASAPGPANPEDRASAPLVDIDAPPALAALLRRHLDLVRLGTLAGSNRDAEPVSRVEWARLIAATPEQARELLQTEGYFDAQASVTTLSEQPLHLRVNVSPGPLTRVVAFKLEFDGELKQLLAADNAAALALRAQLNREWPLKPGAPFRNPAWADAKAAAVARIRAAGYATATWQDTAAQVDAPAQAARLRLVVASGPLFRSGELLITGLKQHDSAMVRSLAGFAPGTAVTETLLLDYQERLQRSGLFDQVSVSLEPDPQAAAAAPVKISVSERLLQQATLALGYSANTGARATVEHVHRRVFGHALSARNKLEWGVNRQAWDGELSTHPGANLERKLLGVAIERLRGDTDVVLSQKLRLGLTQDTRRIERLYFAELERSLRHTETSRSEALAVSGNFHGIWRDLDNAVLPTRGLTLALQGGLGQSRSNTDGNGPFARAYARLTGYLPLGGGLYGQARVELGQVFVRSGVFVPDSQRFRAGGDDSVRGYAWRSLGPVVAGGVSSGDALFTTSLELARPLSPKYPSLWGAVFVDAGGAANNFASLRAATGVGAGVRWRSPVGPLRVDMAWADELKRWRLHFSVGIAL